MNIENNNDRNISNKDIRNKEYNSEDTKPD